MSLIFFMGFHPLTYLSSVGLLIIKAFTLRKKYIGRVVRDRTALDFNRKWLSVDPRIYSWHSQDFEKNTHIYQPRESPKENGPGVWTAHIEKVVLADIEGVAQNLKCSWHSFYHVYTIKDKTIIQHLQNELLSKGESILHFFFE